MSDIIFTGISSEELIKQIVEKTKEEVVKLLVIQKPKEQNCNEEEYLTQKEACEFLKCSSTTLWRLVKQNKISPVKSGRKNLYLKSQLTNYLRKEGGVLNA